MIDLAQRITWQTFIKHVDWEEVRSLFPSYSYRGEHISIITGEMTCPFHIKDDYAVGFYRSFFQGSRCYYIRHSAIEYIFVEDKSCTKSSGRKLSSTSTGAPAT